MYAIIRARSTAVAFSVRPSIGKRYCIRGSNERPRSSQVLGSITHVHVPSVTAIRFLPL